MKNEIIAINEEKFKIFNDKNLGSVRTILVDNEIWFCIKDVCDILEIKNPSDIPKRLDEDEVHRFNLGSRSGVTNFTNESGLYALILRSNKKEAKLFRKWITKDVIPSIRRTGTYTNKNLIENLFDNPQELGKLITKYGEEINKLKLENDNLRNNIQYVYTEDEVEKKNKINKIVRKHCNYNIVGAYIRLYDTFKFTYLIDLKSECDKYNENKEKRLKVNIIQYCLIKGYINQLYGCCKLTFGEDCENL